MLQMRGEIDRVVVDEADLLGVNYHEGRFREMLAQLLGNTVKYGVMRHGASACADDHQQVVRFGFIRETFKVLPIVEDRVLRVDLCLRIRKRLLQVT